MKAKSIFTIVFYKEQVAEQAQKQDTFDAKRSYMKEYSDFDPSCHMEKQQFERRHFRLRQMAFYRAQIEFKKQQQQLKEAKIKMKEIMTEKKRIQSSKAETERVNEHLTSEAKEEQVKPKVIQRVDIQIPSQYRDNNIKQDSVPTYEEILSGLQRLCSVRPYQHVSNEDAAINQRVTKSDLAELQQRSILFFRKVVAQQTENADIFTACIRSELAKAAIGTKFELKSQVKQNKYRRIIEEEIVSEDDEQQVSVNYNLGSDPNIKLKID